MLRPTLVVAATLAVLLAPAPAARAQEHPPAPAPVVIVGNTRFTPLFDQVTLAPGERLERDLEVGAFSRVSLLAAAESAPSNGRVVIAPVFGPPAVPAAAPLALSFSGGTRAARGTTLPVMGPRLTIGVANLSGQTVVVAVSVFAAK